MITINDVKNNGELFDDFIKENQKLVSMVIRNKFRYVNNTADYDDYFQKTPRYRMWTLQAVHGIP